MDRLIPKVVTVLLVVAVCAAGCGRATPVPSAFVVVPDVAAMTQDASTGALYFGNRLTGDVFSVAAVGKGEATKLTHVDVSTDGQRGLLGLAVDSKSNVFAAYTAASAPRRIIVAQIWPGTQRVVWDGPPSADLANGSHIAFAPDGRLVIGIGDLLDRSKLGDIDAPNGKLLSLDTAGGPDQVPKVISSNWNNPYAFTFRPDGSLWVGDNEPANGSERLARADDGGIATRVAHIGAHKVASGLAATKDGSLWECTFNAHSLQRYTVAASGPPRKSGSPIATDCSTGVIALNNGALAYSTGREIKVITPES